jgi:hypothetical protein
MIKYFIGAAADWETKKVKMSEALGHNNIAPRYSLDNSLVLYKFDDENLPEGFAVEDGKTKEEILIILQGPDWTSQE